jgi:hypothetical protein
MARPPLRSAPPPTRPPPARGAGWIVTALGLALAAGCGAPVLSQDGQLVFSEGGRQGASVLTANGVEFIDRADVPAPVVRRSANEPWRPATGFLLPADGIWRQTSTPVAVQGHGLAVVLRSSDTLIPSWGGEILLRLDALAPAQAYPEAAVRAPERLVIVLDGHDANIAPLAGVALDNLGEKDRVAVVDSGRGRAVLPMIPGSHRTLLRAAIDQVVAQVTRAAAPGAPPRTARDLPAALAIARGWLSVASVTPGTTSQVLVITDGLGVAQAGGKVAREVEALGARGVRVTAVGSVDQLDPAVLAPLGADVHAGSAYEEREQAVTAAVPPPGDVVLEDVTISIASTPAPARLIEISGGEQALALDADHMHLGDLAAGEARTEVARVALPTWVPGEPLDLTVTATYRDVGSGEMQRADASIKCKYSNDIAEIASARHGDVIAYASALAMVRRLDRAFAGSQVDSLGGLRPVVALQARSLEALARTSHDPALGAQAEILSTLLGVLED